MKVLTFILVLVALSFFNESHAQGNLCVRAFKNSTLDLNENIQMDSIHVLAINRETGEETFCLFTIGMKQRPLLESGKYDLVCSIKGEEDRRVENITIWADSITLVELLFEPKRKLTRSQKRKRKKLRLIYD